jgi:uridine phosphorylase
MMPDGDPNSFTRVLYGCEADEIAEVALLTPMDSTLEALKLKAENVNEFKGFNYGFNGNFGGTEVSVINSRIGSPVASDCTYYLRFTPCRSIVYTGLIGSLQLSIRVGDIIVPTAALRGEGASKYFIDEAYPAVADFGLLQALSATLEEAYADRDINVHYGPIYTTDSFAAETEEFLDIWRSRNLLGIEMETSAIYSIASMYGIKAASVHIVSDVPVVKKSLFDPVSDTDKGRRSVCTDLLMDALARLVRSI